MAGKMVDDVLDRFDILFPWLAEKAVPKPLSWEYIWMLSIVPSLFGLAALPKNRLLLLQIFIYGTIIFGLLPVIGGVASTFWELVELAQTHHTKNRFLGLPVVPMWWFFFFWVTQTHIYALCFARQLKNSWDKGTKAR